MGNLSKFTRFTAALECTQCDTIHLLIGQMLPACSGALLMALDLKKTDNPNVKLLDSSQAAPLLGTAYSFDYEINSSFNSLSLHHGKKSSTSVILSTYVD